jgi:tetratricopeptide (TPR) repeat protein
MSERRGAARRADRRRAARGAEPRRAAASEPVRRIVGPVPRQWAGLVAAVAVAVYANSLGGALLYDDVNAIVTNALVRTGDVGRILTEPSWWGVSRGPLWRPLTTLTFAANHALHGLAPFGYHLVNVLLHAAVSVAVLGVFARVTGAPRVALGAALLFAAHPIHTEAVANVVGRAELLAALGFFGAWACWLRADAADVRPQRRRVWWAAAVVVYFLAMCGKENAVALPAVLLLADVLRPRAGSVAATLRAHLPAYGALAAVAVLFVVLRSAVIGQLTPGADLLDNPLGKLAFAERLLTTVAVIGRYAGRLLFPYWLSADYSFDQIPAVTTPLDVGFLGGLAVVLAVPVIAWWCRRSRPAVTLGLGVLAATFALVGNVVFLIGTIMGERLAYLPSAGFCLALAAALAAWEPRPSPVRWTAAFAIPLAIVVALYGVRTVARNRVWSDPVTFFAAMTVDAPRSARSHRELGLALAAVGRFDEARRELEQSLAIKPEDASTLYDFGNVASQQGRFEEAVELYQRALRAKPDFTMAMENLGNAESMRGNQDEALVWLRRARELEPDSPGLEMNIANTLFRSGAIAEARAAYERALALAPTSADLLTNYGSFLYTQGDYAAAVRTLERVPPPAPARALVPLAASYRALGKRTEAQAVQARAERLYPADPGVRQVAELLRRDAVGPAP